MLQNKLSGGLTGSTLKWLAIIAMLINHFGDTILEAIILHAPYQAFTDTQFGFISNWHYVFHAIGRISMPIFCFLIVEGFLHTRDAKRYLLRLLLFALISEIPYDLAFGESVFDLNQQNVFFTLAAGLLTLMVMENMKNHRAVVFLAPFVMSVLTFYGKFDGSYYGVLMMALFYILREKRLAGCISILALQLAVMLVFHETFGLNDFFAIIPLILIYFYNGRRGMRLKYFFYAFYPVHLLIFGLLAMFVVIPMYQ